MGNTQRKLHKQVLESQPPQPQNASRKQLQSRVNTSQNEEQSPTTHNGAFIGVARFNTEKVSSSSSKAQLVGDTIPKTSGQKDQANTGPNGVDFKSRKQYLSKLGLMQDGSSNNFISLASQSKNDGSNGDLQQSKYMRHSTIVVGNDHGGIGGLGTRATAPVERQSRRLSEEILPHFGNGIDQKADLETTFAEEIIKCPIEEKTDEKFEVAQNEHLDQVFSTPESEAFELDFISQVKTGDQIRRNFLSKLTYQKVWLTPQEKPKTHESAIIFDWDDTLLCTSFINPSGYYENVELSQTIQQHIKQLEITSAKMLQLSIKYGKTFIITNAAEGWVQFSAQKFMPSLVPILEKITIISARGRYESHFPGEVNKWKLHAFLETQEKIDNALITNIIALGDSMMEMDAAHHLALRFQKALIKTVKFREFPKPNELVKQLNLVIQKFDEICNSAKNLTIRLEKKQQI